MSAFEASTILLKDSIVVVIEPTVDSRPTIVLLKLSLDSISKTSFNAISNESAPMITRSILVLRGFNVYSTEVNISDSTSPIK